MLRNLLRIAAPAIVALALAAPPSANAEGQDFSGALVKVQWAEAPSWSQVAAVYPDRARRERMGGHAQLMCGLDGDLRPTACKVLSEKPGRYGFGAAALQLARDFTAPHTDANGAYLELAGAFVFIDVAFTPAMLEASAPPLANARLVRAPESLDLRQSFPQKALAAHVTAGQVMLACTVGDQGWLTDCSVSSEDPAGLGFGKAALDLSPHFQVSVWGDDGLPTIGGRVSVPIRYQPGAPAATN
ncbi:MAG TPA: hypothetical protein VGS12_04060 [Caulobacteraceae bacterium]|nr:hypothetical protein [Caulobacteraceae bacterium]